MCINVSKCVLIKEQIIASADEVSHTDCEIHLQDIAYSNR